MTQLALIEQLMDFDEKLEEWYIPQFPINPINKGQIEQESEEPNKLAMGFNDYDECKSQIYKISICR